MPRSTRQYENELVAAEADRLRKISPNGRVLRKVPRPEEAGSHFSTSSEVEEAEPGERSGAIDGKDGRP